MESVEDLVQVVLGDAGTIVGHLAADIPDRIPGVRSDIARLEARATGPVIFALPGSAP